MARDDRGLLGDGGGGGDGLLGDGGGGLLGGGGGGLLGDGGGDAALLELMQRTGYSMEQTNGQRKYGPPPGWEGPPPPRGSEVFVGKIPRDMHEDKLVPVFERAGTIYTFRLLMEFNGENRGYAFVTYTTREMAQKAIHMLDNHEIRPGKYIGVCVSLDNCRLFVGSLSKDKTREEIMEEMQKVTDGVVNVIMYPSSTDKHKNRGFAFIEYESHKAAAMARRRLTPENLHLWGLNIQVEWAEPERDVAEETIRVLYVRNLMPGTTEETLQERFSGAGSVERVRRLEDYAFVHYRRRQDALDALRLMNGVLIDGAPVTVSLARPAGGRDGAGAGPGAWGRRHRAGGNRGYVGNNPALVAGGGGGGGGGAGDAGRLVFWREGEAVEARSCMSPRPPRPLRPPPGLGNPMYLGGGGGGGGEGSGVEGAGLTEFPLSLGTPLSPCSLQALKPGQMSSAVSLLEHLCLLNAWGPPDYYLYCTSGPKALLIYKVVLVSMSSSYMPDKLCVLVEEAKELAAQHALWSLDGPWLSGGACPGSPAPLSPPLGSARVGYGARPLTPCLPPSPYPLSSLSPPLPPLSSGLYTPQLSPFY